jgi:hypothetical protein
VGLTLVDSETGAADAGASGAAVTTGWFDFEDVDFLLLDE